MIECHYCGTEYDLADGRQCPTCRHTPIDKSGVNGLQPKPMTVRASGFPLSTKISPNPPNPQHRFHKGK